VREVPDPPFGLVLREEKRLFVLIADIEEPERVGAAGVDGQNRRRKLPAAQERKKKGTVERIEQILQDPKVKVGREILPLSLQEIVERLRRSRIDRTRLRLAGLFEERGIEEHGGIERVGEDRELVIAAVHCQLVPLVGGGRSQRVSAFADEDGTDGRTTHR